MGAGDAPGRGAVHVAVYTPYSRISANSGPRVRRVYGTAPKRSAPEGAEAQCLLKVGPLVSPGSDGHPGSGLRAWRSIAKRSAISWAASSPQVRNTSSTNSSLSASLIPVSSIAAASGAGHHKFRPACTRHKARHCAKSRLNKKEAPWRALDLEMECTNRVGVMRPALINAQLRRKFHAEPLSAGAHWFRARRGWHPSVHVATEPRRPRRGFFVSRRGFAEGAITEPCRSYSSS